MSETRQQYRELTENEKTDVQAIKQAGDDFIRHLDTIASNREDRKYNRELALAKTNAEQAVMWAVKGITG